MFVSLSVCVCLVNKQYRMRKKHPTTENGLAPCQVRANQHASPGPRQHISTPNKDSETTLEENKAKTSLAPTIFAPITYISTDRTLSKTLPTNTHKINSPLTCLHTYP